MSTLRTLKLAAVLATLSWRGLLYASPAQYTFRSVVSTADGVYTSVSNPAIDNKGKVAFNGVLSGGVNGIFTGPDPNDGTLIANLGDQIWEYIGRPAISDNGTIVFAAKVKGDFTPGIYRGPNQFYDLVIPPGTFTNLKDPVINSSGKIAFWGVERNGTQGIYTGSNPATDTFASSANYPFFDIQSGPQITDNDIIAFIAGTNDHRTGIFLGPNPATDAFVDSSGLIGGFDTFTINENTSVASKVAFDDETHHILLGPDPINEELAIGQFSIAGDHMASNSSGAFIFDGTLLGGRSGIFSGDDLRNDKDIIVATGQELFGSTLTALSFDFRGFNDPDQVAFTYQLANGDSGIAIATPRGASAIPLPSAPCPASGLLIAAFALHWAIGSTRGAIGASMRA